MCVCVCEHACTHVCMCVWGRGGGEGLRVCTYRSGHSWKLQGALLFPSFWIVMLLIYFTNHCGCSCFRNWMSENIGKVWTLVIFEMLTLNSHKKVCGCFMMLFGPQINSEHHLYYINVLLRKEERERGGARERERGGVRERERERESVSWLLDI